MAAGYVDVVFDGPPGPVSGRFIEVEAPDGSGISVGEWVDRGRGIWALRIPTTLFGRWLQETRRLQIEAYGADPAALEGPARAEFVRWNAYAAEDEIHEATNEIQWKPWGAEQGRWIDRDAYVNELVDTLHFIGNLLATADCDDAELNARYEAKMATNRARMEGRTETGYDAIGTKCPHCRRALDDVGVKPLRRMIGRTPVPTAGNAATCGGCGGRLEL